MKRKQPSAGSSAHRSRDKRYEQLLAELQQQMQRIEKLELLVYDLEGRQRNIESWIGEEHHAGESRFVTALHHWIAEIDREIARGL